MIRPYAQASPAQPEVEAPEQPAAEAVVVQAPIGATQEISLTTLQCSRIARSKSLSTSRGFSDPNGSLDTHE